jgi:hypothetical protein
MKWVVGCLSEPLLCRLGFHKWQDYGKKVEVFWQEPTFWKAGVKHSWGTTAGSQQCNIQTHSKMVYEGRECKRCGMRLRRKFVTNSDGTLACVGWEPDNEGTRPS